MAVAYSAPTRHMCLGAVENNYCASKRGKFYNALPMSNTVMIFCKYT